jgi:phosphoribosylamine--glycine ligase
MITSHGPRVVEFNCRFGDPETQAILPLLQSNLLELMSVIARRGSVSGAQLSWSRQHAATTVVAADGYPDAPRKGDLIRLPESLDDVLIFHAGTALTSTGELVTAGGRVFAVTGLGPSLADASERSRRGAERIDFPGKRFRTDIGWRELQRSARAS